MGSLSRYGAWLGAAGIAVALIAGPNPREEPAQERSIMDDWLSGKSAASVPGQQAQPVEAASGGYQAFRDAQERVRAAEDRARLSAAGE